MIRSEIDVRTADGTARAWIVRPDTAPRAGVLFYPDAYGVRTVVHAMTERLAGLGYVVMMPNTFYRSGAYPPFDPARVASDEQERARLMAHIGTITPDRVAIDGGAYLDALAREPGVRADRIGITGYCMGGRMAYLTAAHHPDRVRAAAAFHAGGLVNDQPASPHLLAPRVKAALYFGVADQDRGFTPEQQGTFACALAAADVDYRLELYKGKKHGYAVSDHAGAYDEAASERHWRRLESLFGETLG